jgi:hypothetical protein
MKKKTKKKEQKVDWHRIISLSAAGQYITTQLNEELNKLNEDINKIKK